MLAPTALGALLALLPLTAMAGADCTVSAVGVNFGAYDPLAARADDSTGSVTVVCSYQPPGQRVVNFVLKLGTGSSGSLAQRLLASGPSTMRYNLYLDSSRTAVWGDGTLGTGVATGQLRPGPGVGNGTKTSTHTIYGRMPALQQDVAAGSYSDTIIVTLEF